MRVIAGTLKGRRLKTPTWEGLRPTSDKLRETLFNVLAPRLVGARVLDGYAGTGAVGIEAISRGAGHVTFVESDRRARGLIMDNLRACRIESGYTMVGSTVERSWDRFLSDPAFVPFEIVLLDPPYDQPPATTLARIGECVAPNGVVVLEHARRIAAPDHAEHLDRTRDVISGDSTLTFYTCRP